MSSSLAHKQVERGGGGGRDGESIAIISLLCVLFGCVLLCGALKLFSECGRPESWDKTNAIMN